MSLTGLLIAASFISVGFLAGWALTRMAGADRDANNRFTANGVWDFALRLGQLVAGAVLLCAIGAALGGCQPLTPGTHAAAAGVLQQDTHVALQQVEGLNHTARVRVQKAVELVKAWIAAHPLPVAEVAPLNSALGQLQDADASLAEVPKETKAIAEKADAAATLTVKADGEAAKAVKDLKDERGHFWSYRQRSLFWWIVGGFSLLTIAAVVLWVTNPLGIGVWAGRFLVHLLPFGGVASVLQDWIKPRHDEGTPVKS